MSMPNQPDSDLVSRARQSLSRLARFTNHLQRVQLSCGPVTVQQCHTLEALAEGPLSMRDLSDELAIHQSTLTRIVQKLESKALVQRRRRPDNQRVVEVTLLETGRQLHALLNVESNALVGRVLGMVAPEDRQTAVRGMEILCELLDPRNTIVQAIISGCCCNNEAAPDEVSS